MRYLESERGGRMSKQNLILPYLGKDGGGKGGGAREISGNIRLNYTVRIKNRKTLLFLLSKFFY